jgi:hypothetical protein
MVGLESVLFCSDQAPRIGEQLGAETAQVQEGANAGFRVLAGYSGAVQSRGPYRCRRRFSDYFTRTSGTNLTLGTRASATNPEKIGHRHRTQAYDIHH